MVIGILIAAIFLTGFNTCPDETPSGASTFYKKMYATAYCLQGKTYTGKKVRKGIAATGDKSLIGMTALVYQRLPDDSRGDLIGIYEIEDTGCNKSVLDVWCEDLDACQEFMDTVYQDGCQGKVYVEVIEAYG